MKAASAAPFAIAVLTFAVWAPLIDALAFLCLYALIKCALLGQWDFPSVRELVEDGPDIYVLGIGAALAAGVIVAIRQGSARPVTAAFLLLTGIGVGLANVTFLLWTGPDFGQRDVSVTVLVACHMLAFAATAFICWWIARAAARMFAGAPA